MDKIIWQPIQLYSSKADFGVLLDNEFAQMMVSKKLDDKKGLRLNEFIGETIGKRAFNPHILFYQDTTLAVQLNTGAGGVCLAVENTSGKSFSNSFTTKIPPFSPLPTITCGLRNKQPLFKIALLTI